MDLKTNTLLVNGVSTLSGEKNTVLIEDIGRAEILRLPYLQGPKDKLSVFHVDLLIVESGKYLIPKYIADVLRRLKSDSEEVSEENVLSKKESEIYEKYRDDYSNIYKRDEDMFGPYLNMYGVNDTDDPIEKSIRYNQMLSDLGFKLKE